MPPQSAPELRRYIEAIYTAGVVVGEDGRSYEIAPTSVTPERGKFVRDICHGCASAGTLEIGMAWGLSTLFILEAKIASGTAAANPHVVIDPFQRTRYHGAGLRLLKEAGLSDFVEFHEERSEQRLPRLADEARYFDFVFIDGSHKFDGVFVDFRFVDELLKPGGLVVFDDVRWPGVYLTCRFAETNYGYTIEGDYPSPTPEEMSVGNGLPPLMRAYRKPLVPAERPVGHFVPFFDHCPIPDGDYTIARALLTRAAASTNDLRNFGLRALAEGDRGTAQLFFVQALQQEPSHLKTWLRLGRTLLPHQLSKRLGSSGSNRPAAVKPNQGNAQNDYTSTGGHETPGGGGLTNPGHSSASRLPDFIAVGPPRTATTWLYRTLTGHVGLPRKIKETEFFTLYRSRGIGWYASHFRDNPPNLPLGEIAPTYFDSPDAREGIAHYMPHCRIICSLRDPVARLYSHCRLLSRHGRHGNASLAEILTIHQQYSGPGSIFGCSRYAPNIKEWQRLFGREQVLVMIYDDLEASPQGYLDKLCSFLGIERFELPNGGRIRIHEARNAPRSPRLAWAAYRLRHWMYGYRLNQAANLMQPLWDFCAGGGESFPPLDPATEAALREQFRPEVEAVEELLGRDLSAWKPK